MPHFDVQLPLMSVPHVLGIELNTLPATVPYIFVDPQRVAEWKDKLKHIDAVKVGICWQGNPNFAADRQRSIPLRYFLPLSKVANVRLVSLQKGLGTEQISEVEEPFWVTELGDRFDERDGAFIDTAAIIENLDLVITSDTAIAHLAGAMGAEVWLALSYAPDWRWMAAGDRTPWYPSMHLFRQGIPGEWGDVFRRIVDYLAEKAAAADQWPANPFL